MTESEFNQLTEPVFVRIEQAADEAGVDCNRSGGVLELEFDDGQKIIINRHGPNQEIWIAARSGGFHYTWDGARWFSQRDSSELYAKLWQLSAGAGAELAL